MSPHYVAIYAGISSALAIASVRCSRSTHERLDRFHGVPGGGREVLVLPAPEGQLLANLCAESVKVFECDNITSFRKLSVEKP